MKVIGITGNSGSGKSKACEYLKLSNCEIINLDKIGHNIYNNKKCFSEVVRSINGDILTNGVIDRKKLSNVVFSDLKQLIILTEITDKYIYRTVKRQIKLFKKANLALFIIIDGALIFDSKVLSLCDEVILIEGNVEKRIKRIIERDNLSYGEAFRRVNSQRSYLEAEFENKHILYNNDSLEEFLNQVLVIIKKIIKVRKNG